MSSEADRSKPRPARDRQASLVLCAAVVAMGLLAGLFYAFSVAVMPGLTGADDRSLVDGMQQINDAIENPVFYLTLSGAPVLAAVALFQARRSGSAATTRWILAGLILFAAMFVVTVAFNIPLNDDLKQAGDPGQISNIAAVRDDFVAPWVAWNIVRTLAATAAFACLAWALVLHERESRMSRLTLERAARAEGARSPTEGSRLTAGAR